jgi:hypothetical protein
MRDVGYAIWAVVLLGMVAAEVIAIRARRFARLGDVLAALTRTMWSRVLMLVGWMWLGWHFFAR